MNVDVGIHHEKNRGNKDIPLAILSRILYSTIMRNPSLHNSGKGLRMIVLVSLIVLLRGYPCFHDFSHGASLHPYSFIFPLVPHIFQGSRINAATRMRTCVALRLYHVLV